MKKSTKRTLWSLVVIVIILAGMLVGTSFYFIGYALTPADNNPTCNPDSCRQRIASSYTGVIEWIDSLEAANAFHNDTIADPTTGAQLVAWRVAADEPTKKTALIIHGYNDTHWSMLMIGYLYHHSLGYNILLPDQYAHGESNGDHIRMGWLDRLAMRRWLDTAIEEFGDSAEIVVHGISMGGATTMMLSGEENLPSQVKCFVDDCGYTSVDEEFTFNLKDQFGLCRFPIIPATSLLCKIVHGWSFDEASSLRQVAKCHHPMLFIHGDNDTYVPTAMVHPLYEAHPGPKELWLAPGSEHANAYKDHPEEYTDKVRAFVGKYIK